MPSLGAGKWAHCARSKNTGSEVSIDVGQRFRPAGKNGFGEPNWKIWVVERLWWDCVGILHARLVDEKHPILNKTISVATLSDLDYFLPVPTKNHIPT